MWPYSNPGDHDLNKFKSTLPENAATQVRAFLAKWFEKENFKDCALYNPMLKLDSHCGPSYKIR